MCLARSQSLMFWHYSPRLQSWRGALSGKHNLLFHATSWHVKSQLTTRSRLDTGPSPSCGQPGERMLSNILYVHEESLLTSPWHQIRQPGNQLGIRWVRGCRWQDLLQDMATVTDGSMSLLLSTQPCFKTQKPIKSSRWNWLKPKKAFSRPAE